MRRTIALACCVVLVSGALAWAAPPAAGGQAASAGAADPWLARTTRVQFQPVRAADVPFQLEMPKKDWMVLPVAGSVLFMMTSKKGDAVVLVERSVLVQALAPGDITDLFAQIQIDAIKERQPKATDFLSKVLDIGDKRLVALQYSRPGVLGSERVRQYSVPVGKQLYRLTCITSAAQFRTFDPVFSHIAASFTVLE